MAYRLLFVCLGNICRSPAAENIMNHLIEQRGLSGQIVCDSAGTSSYHIGASPDRRMQAAGRERGIPMVGCARQFTKADFEAFDLILAMDRDNFEGIVYLDTAGRYGDRVKLMCDFCRHYSLREVPDPYYGGADGFNDVIDLLLDACEGLLDHIVQSEGIQRGN